MTGQIMIGNNNNDAKQFTDYILTIVDGLDDLNFSQIKKYFIEVSEDEIRWASGYLYYNYNKMKGKGFPIELLYKLLIIKTIAILSLWAGYLYSGGKSPLIVEKAPILRIKEPFFRKVDKVPRGIIIIPTKLRHDFHRSSNFKKLLKIVAKSKSVHKIVIVGAFNSKNHSALHDLPKITLIEIDEEKDSPSYSRNIGIEESLLLDGDVTMFIDDDVIIESPEAIDKLVSDAYAIRGIASPLVKSIGDTILDIFHDYDGTLNGVYYKNGNLLYATTCCMAVYNGIFTKGIKFDESFKIAAGEDIDFSLKLLYEGSPIMPQDSVLIYHAYEYHSNNAMEKFVKRYFRYGIGNFTLLQKYPYYYSLLSECKERPTINNPTKITTVPKEIDYLMNKLKREGC